MEVVKPFKGRVYDKSISYLIQANGKEKSSKAIDIMDFEDFFFAEYEDCGIGDDSEQSGRILLYHFNH